MNSIEYEQKECANIKIITVKELMALKKIKIVDDIHTVDPNDTLSHLHENARLSASYIILLSISTIICTLGLLLDSPATVIGGMIISPLMWPLMKISAGISLARQKYITQSVSLLLISIAVSLISAYIITLMSPLKVLSAEIVSRTQPTLLDILIAFSAGTVAALAIVQKKISSSLAGVAIATSLMPPLCVGGIGLALLNPQVASGGLLLFTANVISIIFVAIFVYHLVGIESHRSRQLQTRAILFVSFMLIITALPLSFFLKSYSFEAMSYQKIQKVLQSSLQQIEPSIYLENVKTRMERSDYDGSEIIRVDADVLVPEDTLIGFNQKESIIKSLEKALETNVILNLRVQKSIALQTETDIQSKQIKDQLTDTLQKEIAAMDKSFSIDTVSVYLNDSEVWAVNAVLRSDPSVRFTENQRRQIEKKMQSRISSSVELDLEIISRISLQGQTDVVIDNIKAETQRYLTNKYPDISIMEIRVTNERDLQTYDIVMVTTIPSGTSISRNVIDDLKVLLEVKYGGTYTFTLDQIEKTVFQYE